jgi:phosphinothricin acetyltransferase
VVEPRLRAAAVEDAEALQAIYAHHVLHGLASFEVDPPSVDEMRGRIARVVGGGFPYLVAVSDDHILGFAYASHFRTRPAYRYTVEDSVYVAPDSAGRGLGRALLMRLIDDCERLGYRQMLAVIGDSANAASIGLHRSCGFAREVVFAGLGFKFGRWVDTVIMQRPLGPGDRTQPLDWVSAG